MIAASRDPLAQHPGAPFPWRPSQEQSDHPHRDRGGAEDRGDDSKRAADRRAGNCTQNRRPRKAAERSQHGRARRPSSVRASRSTARRRSPAETPGEGSRQLVGHELPVLGAPRDRRESAPRRAPPRRDRETSSTPPRRRRSPPAACASPASERKRRRLRPSVSLVVDQALLADLGDRGEPLFSTRLR